MRHLFFLSFSVRCALTCFTSTNIGFDVRSCTFSQFSTNQHRQLLGRCISFLLSVAHLYFLLLSTCTLMGRITLLRRHKKSRQLRFSDGSLDLEFYFHRAVHPMQGTKIFTMIQLHCTSGRAQAPPFPAVPRKETFVAMWPLKFSAGMSHFLCFSDSHFLILT